MTEEVYVFREEVDPLTVGEKRQTIRYAGEIIEVRVAFPDGQAETMQLRPLLEKSRGVREDLFHYAGDDAFVSGDGVQYKAPVRVRCHPSDVLVLEYENVSDTYERSAICDVVVRGDA